MSFFHTTLFIYSYLFVDYSFFSIYCFFILFFFIKLSFILIYVMFFIYYLIIWFLLYPNYIIYLWEFSSFLFIWYNFSKSILWFYNLFLFWNIALFSIVYVRNDYFSFRNLEYKYKKKDITIKWKISERKQSNINSFFFAKKQLHNSWISFLQQIVFSYLS